MRTAVNGKECEWPREVWERWLEVEVQRPSEGVVTYVNYFTPRPWRNEYDRGSPMEGFTYTVDGRHVWQVAWDTTEDAGSSASSSAGSL